VCGPIHTRYFCAQYCDKKVKYIDKFEPWVSMNNQGKLLTKFNPRYDRVFKVNRNLCLKIIKHQNVFLSQYCLQKCLLCIGPKPVPIISVSIIYQLVLPKTWLERKRNSIWCSSHCSLRQRTSKILRISRGHHCNCSDQTSNVRVKPFMTSHIIFNFYLFI